MYPKLISHRGNKIGSVPSDENKPEYIDHALKQFDCEVDLWVIDRKFFLGHDKPQYEVEFPWIEDRKNKLWLHCKNPYALQFCAATDWHHFWHTTDHYTMTSKGKIWAYPTATPIHRMYWAVPDCVHGREAVLDIIDHAYPSILGICVDNPCWYQQMLQDKFEKAK